MNRTSGMSAGQIIGTRDGLQVVAIDIAKLVFQVHTVDMSTGEIVDKQLKRAKVTQYFANKPACFIVMEACGGAHHWGRELRALGHTVRLLDPKAVRPFVTGNKNDAIDACAIWTAAQQPKARFVGIKTLEQQATLTLHRQREQLMKMRNMQANALRGLLSEFGLIFAKSNEALFRELETALQSLSRQIPQMVCDSLREQLARIKTLDQEIDTLAKRLGVQLRQDAQMKRIAQIPGVGVLTATAAIATMGDPAAFKSGRQFCAWLGLVPTQNGTGGKVHLGGISKRGDTYLRTLLIHGARSVLNHTKEPGPWLQGLQSRRHPNVVTVALAAKMARTIWALAATQRDYQNGHQSTKPAH